MAPPDWIQISEELLTEWALSCVHIDHLGTLIQTELQSHGEHARAVDLAERVARSALALCKELRQHGARGSNARIETPRRIQIREEVASLWAQNCTQIYILGTLITKELPRDRTRARAIDLTDRVTRRAWTIVSELIQHGASPPEDWCPTVSHPKL